MYVVNLSGAENRIFCADHTNIMAADDLAPSVVRSSAAMILTVNNVVMPVLLGMDFK